MLDLGNFDRMARTVPEPPYPTIKGRNESSGAMGTGYPFVSSL
jgi:hypothetical protein